MPRVPVCQLPKVVLAAKKKFGTLAAKKEFGTINAKKKKKHDCAWHFVPQYVACSYSQVRTAKSGVGCQKKSLALWLPKKSLARSTPKIKISMIVPDILFRNMLHVLTHRHLHTAKR
jgi:hypothetical protein